MKALKDRKIRLVKASSNDADHNRRQAERISTDTPREDRRTKRKTKRFNPIPISNEDQLEQLKARLVTLDGQAKCASCPPEVLSEIEAEVKACRKAIRGLMIVMTGKLHSKKEQMQIRSTRRSEVHRDTKADAKVPKTAGRGLRGKPEPYTGPGKPGNKIPAGKKPAIIRVGPQGSPDRMKFHKPLRPESVKNAFRAWNSGAVVRRRNDDE